MLTTIKNDEQYGNYCDFLWFLTTNGNMENPVVGEMIDLLTVLVDDYDDNYKIGDPLNPVQLVRSFMDEHDILNGNQLAEEINFDNKYHVVEFLRYKREPSEEFISKFCDRFKVQESALIKNYRLDGECNIHRGD